MSNIKQPMPLKISQRDYTCLKNKINTAMMQVFNNSEKSKEKVGWYKSFGMTPDEHWWLGK